MLCPLLKRDCLKERCAWWDHGDKSCAVLGLKIEMIRLQEALEKPQHANKERSYEPLGPLMPFIIEPTHKNPPNFIKCEAKSEPATNHTQHQASEAPPKIAW